MMLRKSVFILILSVLCFSSFGQSVVKKLESAKSIQSSYQRKGADLQKLLDSADYYLTSNRDQSFYYLEQAYLLTLRKKNSSQHYLVLEKIGDYYAYYQQHDLAAKNYENALLRFPAKLNANPLLFKCGGQYLKSKQAKRSLTLYQKHEEHRNIDKMLLYEAYGDAYFQLNKPDSAMLYFQKSEVIAKNRKDATKLADLKLKMADVYKVKGKDKELDLLNQANVISRSNTNVQGIISSQSKIAEYYERNALPEEEINTRNQLIEDINLNSNALDSNEHRRNQ